jgi:hypothetical protein
MILIFLVIDDDHEYQARIAVRSTAITYPTKYQCEKSIAK